MKVSIVFLGSTGAGPVYSYEFAKALLATGRCDIQVIISKESKNLDIWTKTFNLPNVSFHCIDTYKHTPFRVALSFIQFWKTRKLVQLIKEFNPDFVFFPFGLTWSSIIFPQIARFSKIINTIHDPHPHDKIYNPLILCLNYFSTKAQKYVSGNVILNNADRKYVYDKYKKPIVVIPHATFDYYITGSGTKTNTLTHRIGFVGRIEPYKGLDLLVDYFDQTPNMDLELIIAGSGKIEDDILDKINKDKRIVLINRYIHDDEFNKIFKEIDLLVLPYKRASQSGVIPMSFAFSTPVIATNVGALSEQVPIGTGVLITPDIVSISKALTELYANPSSILEMGKKAKKYADNHLSWSHSAKSLLEFVSNL